MFIYANLIIHDQCPYNIVLAKGITFVLFKGEGMQYFVHQFYAYIIVQAVPMYYYVCIICNTTYIHILLVQVVHYFYMFIMHIAFDRY